MSKVKGRIEKRARICDGPSLVWLWGFPVSCCSDLKAFLALTCQLQTTLTTANEGKENKERNKETNRVNFAHKGKRNLEEIWGIETTIPTIYGRWSIGMIFQKFQSVISPPVIPGLFILPFECSNVQSLQNHANKRWIYFQITFLLFNQVLISWRCLNFFIHWNIMAPTISPLWRKIMYGSLIFPRPGFS